MWLAGGARGWLEAVALLHVGFFSTGLLQPPQGMAAGFPSSETAKNPKLKG